MLNGTAHAEHIEWQVLLGSWQDRLKAHQSEIHVRVQAVCCDGEKGHM